MKQEEVIVVVISSEQQKALAKRCVGKSLSEHVKSLILKDLSTSPDLAEFRRLQREKCWNAEIRARHLAKMQSAATRKKISDGLKRGRERRLAQAVQRALENARVR